MDKDAITVSIPTSLHKRIEERIKNSEYSSVEDFITKVLRENLSKEQASEDVFTKEDEEKVKERLKALGYLD